jgi:hypothetical protein
VKRSATSIRKYLKEDKLVENIGLPHSWYFGTPRASSIVVELLGLPSIQADHNKLVAAGVGVEFGSENVTHRAKLYSICKLHDATDFRGEADGHGRTDCPNGAG